jgi:GDPmannose 4,6-dehydratase
LAIKILTLSHVKNSINYREAYGIHASNGILFNHESPIRGETFVTRKISRAMARIALGMQDCLFMGNLSSRRDWGHAKDYIKAMYLILQQETPDDYVIATGVNTSIRDFIKKTFAASGMEIRFSGEKENETGSVINVDDAVFNEKVGIEYNDPIKKRIVNNPVMVRVDKNYFRPTEVDLLIGDSTKARTKLGWIPEYDLQGLINDMITSDIHLMKKEGHIKNGGFKTFNYFE